MKKFILMFLLILIPIESPAAMWTKQVDVKSADDLFDGYYIQTTDNKFYELNMGWEVYPSRFSYCYDADKFSSREEARSSRSQICYLNPKDSSHEIYKSEIPADKIKFFIYVPDSSNHDWMGLKMRELEEKNVYLRDDEKVSRFTFSKDKRYDIFSKERKRNGIIIVKLNEQPKSEVPYIISYVGEGRYSFPIQFK